MYQTSLDRSDSEHIIDLRSDTLTFPSPEMRKAMAEAKVGDDVFGEDPTVHALEEKCANLFGMEKALFVASGSMGNLISILVHCDSRGSEIIIGDQCHIHRYEQGSYAQFGGVSATILPNQEDGTIDLKAVESSIRNHKDVHQPQTRLFCLENTQNRCGGRILPLHHLQKARIMADKHGIKIHMDGARLMNASVGSGISVAEILRNVDSVSMCLSKGIGAPVGSVIGGTKDFIASARRMRKALGGGWRQAGVLAAAGIIGLESAPAHMIKDHSNARHLAEGIQALMSPVCVVSNIVETNIVLLKTENPAVEIVKLMRDKQEGYPAVAFLCPSEFTIRVVTHWNVSEEEIDIVVSKFAHVLKKQ